MKLASLNPARWFERKESPAFQAIISLGLRGPQWTSSNFASLADQGYVQNSDANACINVLATAAKGVKWMAYRRTSKDEPEALSTDHPLNQLLRRPNPRQGWGAFMDNLMAYYKIAGNTYIARVGPDGKPPLELWTLRPDRMRVVVGTAFNPIERYDYYAGSVAVHMNPDQFGHTCLHIKSFHPLNDWYGLSVLQVASRNIDQSNAWQAWNVALGQNMARPSGALTSDGPLSDEQFEKLKDEMNQAYSGFQNAGRPLLLEAGLKWQQIGLKPTDADWLNGDERTTRKLCAAFGVPPELLGVMAKGGMNDTNFVQARKRLYLETVLPDLDHFRDEINSWLSPMYGDDVYVDYVRDDIEAIQEDRKLVFDRTVQVWNAGLVKMNEARKMIGMEPDDEYGEVYLLPMGKQLVGPDAETHAEQRAALTDIITPPDQQNPNAPGKKPVAPKPPKKSDVEIVEHPMLTAARELKNIL